jgi:protein TonB
VRARVASRRPHGQGQRGTVYITFGVSASGGLTFASISRSSGDPGLDRSVLAAVRSAAPFPAPPAGASLRQRQFSMPFHFQ